MIHNFRGTSVCPHPYAICMNTWILVCLLGAASLHAADLTGKWSGAPFYMVFHQDGTRLTGSGGPDESEQYPIQDARIEDDHITFKVSDYTFDLRLNGNEIRGEMKNGRNAMPVFLRRVVEGAPSAPAQFDVASVKALGPSPSGQSSMRVTAGRITISNVPLRQIVTRAYNLKDYQVIAPEWMDSERYEITATMPAETPTSRVQEMLRNLLTARFRMAVHKESREMTVYGIVAGKNGPKMKEVAPGPPEFRSSGGRLVGHNVDMAHLAEFLSYQVDRPVVDMSGITTHFDIDLQWTPERHDAAPADTTGPTIFEAIEAQLGLRLETRKAPVEVIVIDRAEKVPLPN